MKKVTKLPSSGNPGEIPSPRTSNLESSARKMDFHNPYPTRREYERREAAFRLELVELSDKCRIDLSCLFGENDQFERIPGTTFLSAHVQHLLPTAVFDDSVLKKAQKEQVLRTEVREMPPQSRFYTKGHILFFEEFQDELITQYTLNKGHLTPDEIQKYAQKAMEYYKLYEFSKAAFAINPFGQYLREIEELVLRLDSDLLPDTYRDSKAIGFCEEDGDLEVEMPPDLLNEEYPQARFFLDNCHQSRHEGLVEPGQNVRCYRWHVEGIDYYGKLLDHNPLTKTVQER